MKKLWILALLAFPYNLSAQCTVQIVPPGPIVLAPGDSVELHAIATLDGYLDQTDTLYNGGMSARTLPGYTVWQTFKAGRSGLLTRIEMGFFNYINGIGTFTIYDGAGTTGTILQTGQVNVNCPSGSCMIPFAANVPVESGQDYTFEFIPGAGIPDPYGVQVDANNTYSRGIMYITDPSGSYNTGFDMNFATYVGYYVDYHWSIGVSDSVITVNSSGTYTVTISDGQNCTASDSVMVTVATGLQPMVSSGYNAYAIGDKLVISSPLQIEELHLFSITGAELRSARNVDELPLSGFSRGVYFVLLQTSEGRRILRLVY